MFIQITSTSYTRATGLSKVLDNGLSHDKVTRFLKKEKLIVDFYQATYWLSGTRKFSVDCGRHHF